MIRSENDFKQLENTELAPWLPYLKKGLEQRLSQYRHGQLQQWQSLIQTLPDLLTPTFNIQGEVNIGLAQELDKEQHQLLDNIIKSLHPWRKGPYELFGHFIDCEWRSDWKWQRILPHITSLANRRVLDIGCGNGYHLWQMAGEGAKQVVGIDPSQLFWAQFQLFKHFLADLPVHLFPLGLEHLPLNMSEHGFDTLFCMGVLYHRRSPIDFLVHLKNLVRKGGEIILETLVIEGDENQVLVPEDRYAQMRNVWFIPSPAALQIWLHRAGYKHIELIDINQTSILEQRQTSNMNFQSLTDFLHPQNPQQTIEGYPAPTRATFKADA